MHDATELDYSSLESLVPHLGQIGKGTHDGYICQNVLAVDPTTGELLGMLDQILHCRDEVPEDESLTEHRNRETRESLLWPRGTEHLPGSMRLIDMADQGASTFEFLEHEHKSGRRFVIRNGKVRKVYGGHEPGGPKKYLKEYVESLPELGRFTMDVQGQKGRKARKQAKFALLSAVSLTLLNLRDVARRPDAKKRRAATLFASEYVEVLSLWRYGKLRGNLTIHDFFFALARLSGHQDRRSDHRPGWLILWRGWAKLQDMLVGCLLAKRKNVG